MKRRRTRLLLRLGGFEIELEDVVELANLGAALIKRGTQEMVPKGMIWPAPWATPSLPPLGEMPRTVRKKPDRRARRSSGRTVIELRKQDGIWRAE